jgi:hypothetical protein
MLGSRNGSFVLGSHYELLGVVSGFYHEDSNLTLTTASTYTGIVEQNSGIAMVVPADALKDLLESSPLKTNRDQAIALRI